MDHRQIDQWVLAMMREIVARIDADPNRTGLERARATARRWNEQSPSRAIQEWLRLLEMPWPQLRSLLLQESDEGQRLRSSAPFCGVLSQEERLALLREYRASPSA
ncbi:hypothetical protein DYH09_06070 [bacterium CPR1]|nr:hypothetical protein [bacterium CPR1]